VLADPPGSVLYSWFKTGTLSRAGSSITEGIGQGRVTDNLKGAPIDDAITIPDEKTIEMTFRFATSLAVLVGLASHCDFRPPMQITTRRGTLCRSFFSSQHCGSC
jgi:cysteine synthase A